jgi:hypothetical protein
VFLALLLTAVVLLIPTFLLVGCENLVGTGMTATSLSQNTTSSVPSTSAETTTSTEATLPSETPTEGTSPSATSPPQTTVTSYVDLGEALTAALPLILVTRYEETDPHLVWTGDWQHPSNPQGFSGGAAMHTDYSGASLTINFSGTSISWIGALWDSAGRAAVTLDGGGPVSVTLYSDYWPPLYQQTVWQSGTLAYGSHTLKITCLHDSPWASGGYWISVDAFDVIGTLQ